MAEVTTTQSAAPTPAKPRKKKKKILKRIIALVVVLAILGGVGYGLYRFLNSGETDLGEIYAEPAFLGAIQSKVSGSGIARAKESAAITLTQSGVVQEVLVTAGQTVMAGQPLYTIFSQPAQDAVTAAQEQMDRLLAELAVLQNSVADLTVRAPYSGKLIDVQSFSPEQEVSAGTTVATLVNDRQLRLSLYFSYAYEHDITPGQDVTVSIPAVMNTFVGKVETIHKVNYISPEGGIHFEVVIVFDNPGTLTAGMTASATLTSRNGLPVYPYDGGKTEYYETRAITTKAGGPVVGMGTLLNYADVNAGDVLLQLGTDALDAQIRAKQAEIQAAQTALDEATKALDNFNATAPIDGTVTSCTLAEGNEVKAGETVIIITNNTTMVVTINVDDRNISFVKPGNLVELNWNGAMYMGTVTAIDMGGAQSGSGMTNYPVTLAVDNFDGSLMDGAWLQYSFVTSESSDCILVPSSAVQYFSDKEGNRQSVVFVKRETRPDDVPELDLPVVEPGQKRRFPSEEEGFYPVIVATGLADPQYVEIVSGVELGDEVFVNYTVMDYSGSW